MKNHILVQVDNQLSNCREKFGDERAVMLRAAAYQQSFLRAMPDRPLRAQDAVALQILEKLARLENAQDYSSIFVEIATIAASGAAIIPLEKERLSHLSTALGISHNKESNKEVA